MNDLANGDNSLSVYLNEIAYGAEGAIDAYKETIDLLGIPFCDSLRTKSGSARLNSHVKIQKVNSGSVYGYRVDWDANKFITAESKTTWHDLAWIMNYGHGRGLAGSGQSSKRVMGNYFIKNAQRRLKGLDKKAFSKYKAKMRSATGG